MSDQSWFTPHLFLIHSLVTTHVCVHHIVKCYWLSHSNLYYILMYQSNIKHSTREMIYSTEGGQNNRKTSTMLWKSNIIRTKWLRCWGIKTHCAQMMNIRPKLLSATTGKRSNVINQESVEVWWKIKKDIYIWHQRPCFSRDRGYHVMYINICR